jgi:DNA-binding PadR family transcriptional regulator
LKQILLGLLRKPASGYDLKREFDTSLAHFWAAELSQIYPTLRQLEADGLIVSKEAAPSLGPARVVYKRTAKGSAALADWLAQGPQRGAQRHTDLAQAFFLDVLDVDEAAQFVEAMLAARREELRGLQTIAASWKEAAGGPLPDALPDEEFYPYLTLEAGLAVAEARVAWCERALRRVRKRRRRA